LTIPRVKPRMEAVGVTANVIAVVDLSAKVVKLCVQYAKQVAGAKQDIERLQTQVEHLGDALKAAQTLVKGAQAQSLFTLQKLVDLSDPCNAELQRLETKLGPSSGRKAMRRMGIRALKWPFSSKEVDQILSSLERHEKTILLGLQIDQTFVTPCVYGGY
jgi:conjugal transfer/entry exclusion protein